MIVPEGGLH